MKGRKAKSYAHISEQRLMEMGLLDDPSLEAEWSHMATCKDCLIAFIQAVKKIVGYKNEDPDRHPGRGSKPPSDVTH